MKQLINSLKSGNFKRIYYFYGKDIVSIETLVTVATSAIVPSGDDFNVYRMDGRDFNLNEFMDVAESCPMFADYKCITIHDFNCDTIPPDTTQGLISGLDTIPSSSIVVFYATNVDVTNGKKRPTAKNKKLIDYVAKNGVVYEAAQKSLAQTIHDIQGVCANNHSPISYANAQLVANKCLCDSLTISNEVKKLIDYANGSEITLQMVEDLVSDHYDLNVFKFSDAVIAMDGQLALERLHELYSLRADPFAVLSAVSSAFIDFYRVKAALTTGRGESDILADFNYHGREFVIRNYINKAHRIKLEHIRACINVLKQTNIDLLSYDLDGKILLEKAVVEMVNVGHRYY